MRNQPKVRTPREKVNKQSNGEWSSPAYRDRDASQESPALGAASKFGPGERRVVSSQFFFSASILLIKQPGVVLPQVDQGTCLSARHGIGIAMPWHAPLCPDEMSTPYSPSEPCRPGVPAAFMSPAVTTPLLAFSSPSIAVYTFPSSRE